MLPVDYLLFLQIAFFLCITPGTPRVVITTYAINYGLRRSTITAFGDISANTIQMIFVAKKVVAWLKTNPKTINTISACALLLIAVVFALSSFGY